MKGIGLNRLWIVMLIIVGVFAFGFASQVQAALVDPVSLWIFDEPGLPGDGSVTFELLNVPYSGTAVLQYKIDGSPWVNADSQPITVLGEQHQLTLQLIPNGSLPAITRGDLRFLGPDGIYYNSAIISWDKFFDITVVTPSNKDKLSSVPIPGALLLFAPALLGLIGLRSRFTR
jgi:hypothetical protein